MPDKKLTDNEIKKALEYWREFDKEIDTMLKTCSRHDKILTEQKEIVQITFGVFDLINRLQANIEKLNGEIRGYKVAKELDTEHYKNEINCLQAENEEMRKGFEKILAEVQKAEELYVKDILNAKAEAVTEFAERLKEKSNEERLVIIDFEWAVSQNMIDNLLKEMVGDNQ